MMPVAQDAREKERDKKQRHVDPAANDKENVKNIFDRQHQVRGLAESRGVERA